MQIERLGLTDRIGYGGGEQLVQRGDPDDLEHVGDVRIVGSDVTPNEVLALREVGERLVHLKSSSGRPCGTGPCGPALSGCLRDSPVRPAFPFGGAQPRPLSRGASTLRYVVPERFPGRLLLRRRLSRSLPQGVDGEPKSTPPGRLVLPTRQAPPTLAPAPRSERVGREDCGRRAESSRGDVGRMWRAAPDRPRRGSHSVASPHHGVVRRRRGRRWVRRSVRRPSPRTTAAGSRRASAAHRPGELHALLAAAARGRLGHARAAPRRDPPARDAATHRAARGGGGGARALDAHGAGPHRRRGVARDPIRPGVAVTRLGPLHAAHSRSVRPRRWLQDAARCDLAPQSRAASTRRGRGSH